VPGLPSPLAKLPLPHSVPDANDLAGFPARESYPHTQLGSVS
jgi:hypothetical protein